MAEAPYPIFGGSYSLWLEGSFSLHIDHIVLKFQYSIRHANLIFLQLFDNICYIILNKNGNLGDDEAIQLKNNTKLAGFGFA